MKTMDDALKQLDVFVERAMKRYKTPGLTLALTDGERSLVTTGYGYADVAASTPATPEHLFEIGSIGKSFTAIALLQLREEGRVDFHAPVIDYIPWFSVPSEYPPITIHHLLSHTSGLTGGTDFSPDQRFELWSAREVPVAHAPGEHFHYSNLGFKLLGQALERLEGKPYADIIQERILGPLGMTNTFPYITHALRPRMAVGYSRMFDDRPSLPTHPLVPASWLETDTGDGCIVSIPSDMTIYLRMLLNKGVGSRGRLMSEESFDLMTTPVISVDDGSYTYGLRLQEPEGRRWLGHGGGMVGYHAAMLGDRDSRMGVMVHVNGPGVPGRVAGYATRLLNAVVAGDPLPEPPDLSDPSFAAEDAAVFEEVFRSETRSFEIISEGNRLSLSDDAGTYPMRSEGEDSFIVDAPGWDRYPIVFGREDQRVVEVLHGGEWFTSDVYSGPRSFDYPTEWDAYPGHYRSHNPWVPSLRIVLVKGQLQMLFSDAPDGFSGQEPLRPMPDGSLGVVEDGYIYDGIRFDTVVDGQALRLHLSAAPYYRFFTP